MSNRDLSRSVLTLKYDDDFGRLGFVGRQTGHFRIAPVGNVYYRPSWRARLRTIVRLYDIQSITVEEERLKANTPPPNSLCLTGNSSPSNHDMTWSANPATGCRRLHMLARPAFCDS
jgi:hypothetical protein